MSSGKDRPSNQELINTMNGFQQSLNQLRTQITELERDSEEHVLVIETLEETMAKDPDRKCWRMIDNVLVERTVKDVLPELKGTLESFREATQSLAENYQKKEKESREFAKQYDIQIKA